MTMTMIPIVVTLLGIVTEASDVHPSKEPIPDDKIRVTYCSDDDTEIIIIMCASGINRLSVQVHV